MNEIRLILYVIILIVSIVNIISFYSGKRRQKKISGSLAEDLKPIRNISTREASALNHLHKRKLAAGMPVFRVEGPYESNTLTVNHSQTEKIITIGGIVVEFHDQLESFLQDNNRVEIVDVEHKKGAVILNMNDRFSAVDEADIRKAMEEGKTYQKRLAPLKSPSADSAPRTAESHADAFEFHQGRELSDEERNWLASDYRTGACILTSLLLLLAVVIPVLPVKALFTAVGLALFLIFLLPRMNRIIPARYKKKSLVLSGNLKKGDEGWFMDRFTLDFPSQWEEQLREDEKCTLEGYPVDPLGTTLKVISLNNLYTIQRELKREPVRRKERWLLFSILGGIALILSLLPLGKIPYKGAQIFNYFTTQDCQRDFKGYDEMTSYPFRNGQKVKFTEFQALPVLEGEGYGYNLIPGGRYKAPEFSDVKEALTMIEELQQSDEMLQLTALELREEMAPSEFLYEYYPETEPAVMADFASYYEDNQDFHILSEIFETLRLLPQDRNIALEDRITFPQGGYLKEYFGMYSEEFWTVEILLTEIGSVKGSLLWDEGIRINDLLIEEYHEYLNALGALRIETYETPEYISFVNNDELARFRRSNIWRGNQRLPMEFHDPIKGFAALAEFEEALERAFGDSRDVEGIITAIEMEGSRVSRISLDEFLDYDDIPLYLGDEVIFLVLLILTGYALASLLRILQLSKRKAFRPYS